MATQVENRVVAMEFDNKNFEKNMAQSMKTIQEFDESLNFKGAEKGFKTLEDATKKCDLSPLSNAVATLEMKFSALQIAGVTAISKIVSSAMDAGTRLVKSLSIEPVTSGFAQYETKVASVQTIMNATGKAIEDVEKTLGKLAIFTDETSYSFGDMVDNIGKFTSNNIELERAANAMQGISNWAAVSGQNSQAASRAMYNLSQALSVGAVTAMDWKSIELANMATKEFKETVIQTAKDMGKLTEEGKNFKGNIVNATNFRETLSDKWFDSDVLIATLEKYNSYSDAVITIMEQTGVDAQDAMAQVDAYMEESGDKTLEFGKKAFKAAQEAKTFTDAINATKDAVKTGWQKTFDIIFGNYEEATELWTNLTGVLWDVFASGASARNELLQGWKDLGGRTTLITAIGDAFQNVVVIVDAFKKALRDVFPAQTSTGLYKITKGIGDFIKQLRFSDAALKTVTNAVRTFLIPIRVVADILEATAIVIAVLTVKLFRLADSFLAANSEGGVFNNLMLKIFGEDRYRRLGEAMNTILGNMSKAFSNLVTWVKGLFQQTPQAESMHKIFEAISNVLSPIAGWILDRLVDGFELLANLDFSNLINLGTDMLNGMVSAFQSIIQYVPPVTGNIGAFLEKFSTATPAEFFTLIADGFAQLKLNWDKFKANFTISGLAKSINTQLNNLMGVIDGLGDAFVRLVERLDPAKILVSAFGVTLVGTIWSVKRAIEASTSVMNNFAGVLGAIKKRIEPKSINPTVKALIALAGALAIMALVPADRLKQATVSMISLMASLTIATGVLSGLSIAVDKLGVKTGAVKQLSITMTYISGAVLALSAAMAILSTIDLKGLLPSLLTLGAIMAALTTVCVVMAKHAKELTKGSGFMIAYAVSLNLMIMALQKLSGVDLSGIQKNLGALILVVGMLGVIGVAASKVKFTSAAAMTGMILNIILFCGMLKILSKIDMSSILKGLVAFIPIIGAITAIGLALRVGGKDAVKMGGTFLALSASILILAQGIKALSSLDAKQIAVGAAAIGGMIIVFSLFAEFSKLDKNQSSAKLGGTFVAMSSAIILLTGAIYLLGNMKENVVRQGTTVVMAILAMFTVIVAIGKESKGAMGAILSMTAAIGALTAGLMLLTLIDEKELLVAATAMSAVFIAFGLAMRNLKSIKLKDAVGSIAPMVLIIGGLSGALYILAKMDLENVLGSAIAMAGIMTAFGLVVKLIDSMTLNDALTSAAMLGAMISELALVFTLIRDLDGAKMIAQSTALSLAVVSFGSIVALLSMIKVGDIQGLLVQIGGIGLLITEIALIMGVIGAVTDNPDFARFMSNGAEFLKSLTDLLPVLTGLTLLVGAMQLISAIPLAPIGGVFAIEGALGVLILGVSAIMGLLGALISSSEAQNVMKNGIVAFELIGAAIGGFIGNIIGGLIGGVATGSLLVLGDNLATFSDSIQPFLQLGANYDKSINENISNFVGAVSDITRAGQIWNSSGLDFEAFGLDFENFGPHLGNFIKGISDVEFDAAKVDSASNAAKAIANILEVLPQEGGLKGIIFGSTDFGGFVTALGQLGPAIAQLASDVEGISENAFDNAIKALSVVASFAKNDIPATGGFLQGLIGEQNLGVFGEQLENFSKHFVPFAENISNVDESVITNSKVVAEAIGAMAAVNIPATGGFLQGFLGNSDVDIYGEKLESFAPHFRSFSNLIGFVDNNVVEKSKLVAESIASMASVNIPSTGGLLNWLSGKTDLATFGTQLQSLGSGLNSFNTSIKSLNVNKMDNAINSISDIASMSGDLSDFDKNGVSNFVIGINRLSSMSITEFSDTWSDSSTEIASTINNTISNIAKSLSYDTGMGKAAETMISGFVEGVNQNGSKISQAGANLGTNFTTSVRGSYSQQVSAGNYIVSGLVKGIDDSIPDAKKAITTLTNAMIEEAENNLQIASPSKRFMEIGKYIVEGLRKGINDNTKNADESILGTAKSIYGTIVDFFQIHSPSVTMMEVGKYIVQGIGEGMKSDMSAEEIAKQKAQNILSAFSDAATLQSAKFKQNDLLDEIWQLEHQLASNEELIARERTLRQENLTEAVKEYNDAKAKQQALDKVGADKESKDYLEVQNEILEAKKNVLTLAQELAQFDRDAVQALRDQQKAIEELHSESRDLQYETWELTHKNATTKETYDKKEEIMKLKLTDQQSEYNRLVQTANDLIAQGYDMESTQVLTALNNVNKQYNEMLTTVQSINDLTAQRKADAITEAETLKQARMAYYEYMNSDYVREAIENGAPGMGDTREERLANFDKYARELNNLDENLQFKVDEKTLESLIDVNEGLEKLAEPGALSIDINLNLDTAMQNALNEAGFDEDFLAEFPIFDQKLIYEKSVSSGKTISNGISDGISSGIETGSTGSGGYGQKILGWLGLGDKDKLEEEGEDSGKWVATGVEKGILDFGSSVKEAAVDLFNKDVKEPFDDAAGTASPSKEMAESGMWLVAGVAKGMKDNKSMAINAAEQICKDILSVYDKNLNGSTPSSNVVSPVVSAINNLESSGNLSPVIRPVVDLDDLKKGTETAKTLLDKAVSTSPFGNTFKAVAQAASEISKTKSQNEAILSQGKGPQAASSVTFNQTINSPKPLSRLETYRDTQALLSQAKTIFKTK